MVVSKPDGLTVGTRDKGSLSPNLASDLRIVFSLFSAEIPQKLPKSL